MKPLLLSVVAISFFLAIQAHPENIEDVKELPQTKEPVVEAEESDPQARVERCTNCGSLNLKLKSPRDVLASLQNYPGAEVHTQQSFEGCSSEKGCAGIKVKDGRVIEKYGNADSFKAAEASDSNNEFNFITAASLANKALAGLGDSPFWWMNQESPFKGSGGNFQKFSKSSSSFSSSGAVGGAGAIDGSLNLGGNPFLNGDFAKGFAGSNLAGNDKSSSSFQSSSFQSSYSSGNGEMDLSKNPFLNGDFKVGQSAQGGFGAQAGLSSYGAQSGSVFGSNSNSFSGYSGSSPRPFSAGSGVNLIQNGQKASAFDFDQQQTQQNIDELFQGSGNVQEVTGGELQQTCAGQGYVCVPKAQCNNGVVNSNGANLLQARTKKQYCNLGSEICCRLEVSSIGVSNTQGSLGIGGATFAGQGNLFQSNSFGASQTGQTTLGKPTTSQTNFIDTDSFTAGSENAGVYRPGSVGLRPGIPYLPPVDNTNSGTVISSTAVPKPIIVTTPRPYVTPKPTYLPPVTSTSAPGYLPPVAEQTINRETIVPPNPPPKYDEGQIILDETRNPRPRPRPTPKEVANDIPAGCAAALKCTPIEFCTAEGVISNTSVILTRDQDAYRVPLTDCKDLETGRIGKCCRDPYYTDPWPTNQLGKWVPGVFGGNDGKYVPDSRGSANNAVPVTPPSTGSVLFGNFRTTAKPTIPTFVTSPTSQRFPTTIAPTYSKPTPGIKQFTKGGKGQIGVGGQGQYGQFGQGQVGIGSQGQYSQFGQGQYAQGGQGQIAVGGQGEYTQVGKGQIGVVGQGQYTKVGQGQIAVGGQGEYAQVGKGQIGVANQGQFTQVGQGQIGVGGQGQYTKVGQGQIAVGGQGEYTEVGQGQIGVGSQGQFTKVGQGQVGVGGQGQYTKVGQGQIGVAGQGEYTQVGQGQIAVGGQGQYAQVGKGQIGVIGTGQIGSGSQVNTAVSKGQFGQGAIVSQGQGTLVSTGEGQLVTQGQGTLVNQGVGQVVTQGKGQFGIGGGQIETQGQGVKTQFGQGQIVSQGQGAFVTQGTGQTVSQEFGTGIRQGQGFAVKQGGGFGVENEYGESVQRVFLQRYNGNGQCGVLNPQRPYGNRNDLEVDFAEIPWQAMVLLQTNRSLLCGGVITRPDVVVTSAACVEGLDAKNVLIKGGEYKLGIDDEPLPFQIVQVKTILRHPFYKRGSYLYDAAILVLTENLRLAKNIQPICLPSASDSLDAFYNGAGECIVTGWGKIVLQAHLEGSIMHSVNVSLINPGECQAKLASDYPHLLEQYSEDSCVCGQPTNPINNICKVDIGSALACTTGDGHYVMRGVYSWDSGCQIGNQIASFYKFDLEWYEWAIGLIESVRFAQFSQVSSGSFTGINSGIKTGQFGSGVKTQFTQGIKGGKVNTGSGSVNGFAVSGKGQYGLGQGVLAGQSGQGSLGFNGFAVSGKGQFGQGVAGQFGQGTTSQFGQGLTGQFGQGATGQFGQGTTGQFGQGVTGKFGQGVTGQFSTGQLSQFASKFNQGQVLGGDFNTQIKSPITNSYSATYSEKKVFQTEPKIVTFTTKPEIVTFTTKPEYFTYTTKPKIVTYTTKPKIITYTTKPQIITYETSGSGTNPQYVAPGVNFKPNFSEIVGAHQHTAKCKCLENK
ncbi:uncharacterized protein LOC126974696 [Leptidea sinapis]|uniref:uncharacterized protein LOC126974696 n=1 Tax=Leptidea sinapis TaxID=189913 RepID=UPI0021444D21|nr:uncharacterized protein LOC126974696 [Leptidea sinapis]